MPQITMIHSVDSDFVAGELYNVPVDVADKLILKGYASGSLTNSYTGDELAAATALDQSLTFQGV